ncbi:DUF488 domain-containing protein [Pseudodesulfovibrio thermohalotolerans]|uniref:DUF488 domain-containing protein n=1 Tax=Pseudodesulfovibrio thermohalotolerans TaxID=2880651 RepID=UPI002443221C|nr:DUF488 domain-containing protein [Pseudodesulfovibrio thermohalotolerans]WFS62301.1 DUF488 domain-containing protein [Pseudodesulfovibrio thermohalotolerans]
MIKLYTVGFAKKSAEEFFTILKKARIKTLVDVRLNNVSQLAGFTKKNDLKFFLKEILGANYEHVPELAPTKEILDSYKKKQISWEQYTKKYEYLLNTRNIGFALSKIDLNDACFLCSEPTAGKCHRRLAAEYLQRSDANISILHL